MQNNHNLHQINLLFAESGKCLGIHLIPWWILYAIQVVPFNEKQGNANEVCRRINDKAQMMCGVVFSHHVGNQSIQKEREKQENVPNVYTANPGW